MIASRDLRVGLVSLHVFACATALHGTRETIAVTSSPSGAHVTVQPGGEALTTPGRVELARGSVYLLTFELVGHRPRAVELAPEYSWAHFGNLLLGGVIGSEIDQASGAAFKLGPNPAHAVLRPLGEAPPFGWPLEIAMPSDLRETAQPAALMSLGQRCDVASPFGAQTAYAVQQRLRGKLLNSGLFESVATSTEAPASGRVRAEVLAMCSQIDGFISLRVVGVSSFRFVLERNGVVLLEKTYAASVSDRDAEYTGSQVTTREQARIRTVLDSANVALDQFVADVTATGKLWTGRVPTP